MLYLLLDDESSRTFGICIAKRPDIPTPELETKFYQTPGRHGSLTVKESFRDIEINIPFNLLEDTNVKQKLREFKGWLFSGKEKMRFSDDDVYYIVKAVKVGNINNEIEEYGEFEVTFTCDPFQYAVTDAITVTGATKIPNVGTFEAQPIIVVRGNGDGSLKVNENLIQFEKLEGFLEIDAQNRMWTKDNVAMGHKVKGDFPIFKLGTNEISFQGGIKELIIDPKWRYI